MKKNSEKAVALKYKARDDRAPKVTAKGSGLIAQKIIELAKSNNIPIKDDPDLVNALSLLSLYEEIPHSLYKVIAEIIAFFYHVNKKRLEG
ncbi:MAG: EscU/YscU/HrcU family type III secretion system export apparatus switch protein [Deltaproteobacteria bacterium]|nr:EscU/YscU/HrcU family type III secretion system export apparatus switch protein [Deltaproteobacteria bacterium]